MGSFGDLLAAQRALQIDSFNLDPTQLEGDARAEFIRWNVLALEDELHEALAETGWKPWASSRHLNEEQFIGELVDAFHFFMNLLLVAKCTETEFLLRYSLKRQRNAQRQLEGYDGVDGKCPTCKRDMQELGSNETMSDRYASEGKVFCSERCAAGSQEARA